MNNHDTPAGPGMEPNNISQNLVAIKIMDKKRLLNSENGVQCLVREIRVHWLITDCDGVLQLLEIYEDDDFVYLVLEYQK